MKKDYCLFGRVIRLLSYQFVWSIKKLGLIYISLLLFTTNVFGQCTIDNLFEFVDEYYDAEEIIEECGHSFKSRRCSLDEIVILIEDGHNATEIREECGRIKTRRSSSSRSREEYLSSICQTPAMWCRINQRGQIGSPCWCNTAYGAQNGRLVQE